MSQNKKNNAYSDLIEKENPHSDLVAKELEEIKSGTRKTLSRWAYWKDKYRQEKINKSNAMIKLKQDAIEKAILAVKNNNKW